jgi:hypothetical protein
MCSTTVLELGMWEKIIFWIQQLQNHVPILCPARYSEILNCIKLTQH